MNKLIKAVLESKFPKTNVADLMEVVESTPNAEIAAEILCGLYELPVINEVSYVDKNAKFISYDKWRDEVKYSYSSEETKSGYFTIDKSELTLENFEALKTSSNTPNAKWLSIKTGAWKTNEATCSLSTWNNYNTLR